MEVILEPVLADLDYKTLNHLAKEISLEYENMKVTVPAGTSTSIRSKIEAEFQFAFDKQRNQWNSIRILEWLLKKFNPTIGTKILGIFNIDAYSNGFDFVFGEAFYRGRVAAIYISRIREEFYGLKPNSSLFYGRMVKEAIHELGHAFAFVHCNNPLCVMHFSTSLPDIDTKERSFCHSCRKAHFSRCLK